jgi:diaminopimelate epimerase
LIIPFTKTHGAGNDFLLSRADDVRDADLPVIARAICDRHTGMGADGWMLMDRTPAEDCDAAIRLFNADGSEPELSGNGTRCAAALLVADGVGGPVLRIRTGAGVKELRLIEQQGRTYRFEMDMGVPRAMPEQIRYPLPLARGAMEATIVDVGNPQCVVMSDSAPADWREIGAEIERHPMFPGRTNVSFVRVIDEHTIEVLFFERGVGETLSSGTGATGAAAAAILRDLAKSPVRIITAGAELSLRWSDTAYLTGPAQIVGAGEFYFA